MREAQPAAIVRSPSAAAWADTGRWRSPITRLSNGTTRGNRALGSPPPDTTRGSRGHFIRGRRDRPWLRLVGLALCPESASAHAWRSASSRRRRAASSGASMLASTAATVAAAAWSRSRPLRASATGTPRAELAEDWRATRPASRRWPSIWWVAWRVTKAPRASCALDIPGWRESSSRHAYCGTVSSCWRSAASSAVRRVLEVRRSE